MNKLTKHTSFISLKLSGVTTTPKTKKKSLKDIAELENFFYELQKKRTSSVKLKCAKASG